MAESPVVPPVLVTPGVGARKTNNKKRDELEVFMEKMKEVQCEFSFIFPLFHTYLLNTGTPPVLG
jgi:hypothetical protein